MRVRFFGLVGALCLGAQVMPSAAATVNIAFQPLSQTVEVGDVVEVDIIVSSNGPGSQPFAAIDAILAYDPTKLVLINSVQDNEGAAFFVTGFLPDPDDINDDLTDGLALFTALSPPGAPISAPVAPAQLIVTTLRFVALDETPGTIVSLVPEFGTWGETRVLLDALNITGDISGTATVIIIPQQGACCLDCGCSVTGEKDCISMGGEWQGHETTCADTTGVNGLADVCETCPGDTDLNSTIDIDDLFFVIGEWGPAPPGDCRADINLNGVVDIDDLFEVILAWGDCP